MGFVHGPVLLGLLLLPVTDAPTTTAPVAMADAARAEAVARAFIAKLSTGQAAAAEESFDATMRSALPPDKLADLWKHLEAKLGTFQLIEKVEVKQQGSLWSTRSTTRFAQSRVILRIPVSAQGQIAGLWVDPVEPDWTPPPYATLAALTDRALTVRNDPPLPGHLTVPSGKGPFAVAILVHGSGPGDEDETVGPNKPFKDIALGLASKGIAVLRYDKRTRVPPLPAPLTVHTEYFPAVAEAIALARKQKDIDPHRIVLVGHSQGAQLAPWLAKENPGLAGIALLAPPTRSPLESAITQFEQLVALHPKNTEMATQLADLKKDEQRLRTGTVLPDEIVFHAPGRYWASLQGYDAIATAAALALPIFVAQGERDANVLPAVDYTRWQAGLAKKTNATFKLYPNLNHLFISWGGKPSVEDNLHPGHVEEQLVSDLAAWINGLPATK
jgi:pimeloyl-ACP methyl ester carboxylesterase